MDIHTYNTGIDPHIYLQPLNALRSQAMLEPQWEQWGRPLPPRPPPSPRGDGPYVCPQGSATGRHDDVGVWAAGCDGQHIGGPAHGTVCIARSQRPEVVTAA